MLTNNQFLNNNRLLTYILFSLVILFFIFLPTIISQYYAGDDFRYSFGGFDKTCASDDGFYFVMTLGRPVQAYLDCLNYKFASSLPKMAYLRFFCIMLMSIGIGLFAEFLFSLGLSFWAAFFAAGSVFLVPGLYADTLLNGATSLPIPLIFVLLAYLLSSQSRFILSSIFLMMAILTYPAMAFFFPVLMLCKLLFSDTNNWMEERNKIIKQAFFFVFVCGIYFIGAYINMHYFPQAPIPEAYRLDKPNFNIHELSMRLAMLFNPKDGLWTAFPAINSATQGTMLLYLLSAGLFGTFIHFFQNKRWNRWSFVSQKIVIGLLLFVLASGFFLSIPSLGQLERRFLFGTFSAYFIIAIWCMYQTSHVLPQTIKKILLITTLATLFVWQAIQAHIVMTAVSLSYVKNLNETISLMNNKLKSINHIHFIIPQTEYPYTRFFLANGALNQILGKENYVLTWCSLPRGVPGEEKDHQTDSLHCINSLPKQGIAVTYSYQNQPYLKTKNMLVIARQDDVNNYWKDYLKTYYNINDWTLPQ